MPDTPKSSRHKNVTMTPAQRAKWKRDVAAIEEEKPALTRWANDVHARKRAMLLEVTELCCSPQENPVA